MAKITFIQQNAPVDEYGRAIYAVARSVLRALLDSLSPEDLTDLGADIKAITMRQLAHYVRIERDKGMKGDGFEWAVHEAILGKEPLVMNLVSDAIKRASRFVSGADPTSLLFGYERAKYLGFLDAVVADAGANPFLLPEGSGRPYKFGSWVAKAAKGAASESELTDRIKKIWKTDLFLSCEGDEKHFAATVKSNFRLLEGGRGLRIGIVPESTAKGHSPGVSYSDTHGLWIVTLPDPTGFTGIFNDGFNAVARAVNTIGKLNKTHYYSAPSAKARRVQEQLEKYPTATVLEIESALNDAAQQNLVSSNHRLVNVNAPAWLRLKKASPKIIAPKPSFKKL